MTLDLGVLLSLPVESITVRVVFATVAGVFLARLLLRAGLRTPRARIAVAFAPAGALAAVVVLTGTSLGLPEVMMPTQGLDALAVPMRDGYQHFAPIAAPLLVGLWAVVAATRGLRRLLATVEARTRATAAVEAMPAPARVDAIAQRLAAAFDLPAPRVAVARACPGGAYVVGTRRPVVVVDGALVERLDDEELEGVLAHELAHVRRRDTLVATLLGVVRDVTFFVPGGGWAIRQLHRERELAADQAAVRVTGRPGALASGLLKVLERGPAQPQACAALAPSGDLVDRVRVLVDDRPAPSPLRRRSETTAVAVVVVGATAAALVVPSTIAGPERQREAVAVVWSPAAVVGAGTDDGVGAPARAFDVYRRASIDVTRPNGVVTTQFDESSQENRRAALVACTVAEVVCPAPDRHVGLGLRPRPEVTMTVDEALTSSWASATPVGRTDGAGGFGVYWLTRAQ